MEFISFRVLMKERLDYQPLFCKGHRRGIFHANTELICLRVGFVRKPHLKASGSFHTTLEEFENGGCTLKTHRMFFVHTTPEESFEQATNTGDFRFVLEEKSVRKMTLSFSMIFQLSK